MSADHTKAARVLMVTHYYPAHGGGIERVAGQLTRVLGETTPMAFIWMASGTDNAPVFGDRIQCIPVPAWNGLEKTFGIPYPIWSVRAFVRMWREVSVASIVYLHEYLYLGSLLAAIMAARCGKPLVITQHSLAPRRGRLENILLTILNRTLGAWALARATRVVFVSDAVRHYFERVVSFKNTPLTIPNGVDTRLFRPAAHERRVELRADLGIDASRPLLLFVGRFVEIKGLAILKELAGCMKDCTWAFVGRGHIDPAAWRLPNVRVLGEVTQEALVPIYQAADLMVLPSRGEGFPLVIQEAMSCGTPVMTGLDAARAFEFEPGLLTAVDVCGEEAVERWHAELNEILGDRQSLDDWRERVAAYAHATWCWGRCASTYADEVFMPIIGALRGSPL